MQVFREQGIPFATLALAMGASIPLGVFAVLLGDPLESEGFKLLRQPLRLILGAVFLVSLCLVAFRRKWAIEHYVPVLAIPAGIAHAFLIVLALAPTGPDLPSSGRLAALLVLTHWLTYGASRLPVVLVAAISMPAAVAVSVNVVSRSDDIVEALLLYVFLANIVGWLFSVQLERRERALFWNSVQLEQATAALAQKAEEAAAASSAKSKVLAAVSHDLRQPMSSLALYVDVLRSRKAELDSVGVGGALDSMTQCLEAMDDNLARFLDAAKLQGREAAIPLEPTDLARILDRVAQVYGEVARKRGIRLSVHVPAPGTVMVLSSETALWDVLSNLVSNALKFSARAAGRRPWVCVRAVRTGGGIRLDVCDNGIGIDPAHHDRIYDAYFQVGSKSRGLQEGYGLGLSVVRETLQRLKGHRIGLTSAPQRGTRFRVWLPKVGSGAELA